MIVRFPAVPLVAVLVKLVYVAPVHQDVFGAPPDATQVEAIDGWKEPEVLEELNEIVAVSVPVKFVVNKNGPRSA